MDIKNVETFSQQKAAAVNALNQIEMKSDEAQALVKKTYDGLKEDYATVSKDGDTLTLSENYKAEGMQNKDTIALKMTDAVLAKCSSSKLRQLLQQGKISKQQYEKAMKKGVAHI